MSDLWKRCAGKHDQLQPIARGCAKLTARVASCALPDPLSRPLAPFRRESLRHWPVIFLEPPVAADVRRRILLRTSAEGPPPRELKFGHFARPLAFLCRKLRSTSIKFPTKFPTKGSSRSTGEP